MQQTIKQTNNFGQVIGLLKDKDIKFGTSKKSGKDYAMGTLTIEVHNETGINEIRVKVMQMALKKDGGENKLYKALQTIASEYKTIVKNGKENADTVVVSVELEENNYYNKNEDKVVESVQLSAKINEGKYISRIGKDTRHIAELNFGGCLKSVTQKDDSSLDIELVGVNYSGQAVQLKATVSKDLAGSFRGIYIEGCTTDLFIDIVNSVQTISQADKSVAFGAASNIVVEKRIRKYDIKGGKTPQVMGITQEQVVQLTALRKAKLEEVLADGRAKKSEQTSSIGTMGNVTTLENNNPFASSNPFGSTNPFAN